MCQGNDPKRKGKKGGNVFELRRKDCVNNKSRLMIWSFLTTSEKGKAGLSLSDHRVLRCPLKKEAAHDGLTSRRKSPERMTPRT